MRFTAVIRPNQPTTNRSAGIPRRRRTSVRSPSKRTRGSRSIPSRTTSNFDGRRDVEPDELVPHLGAHGDEPIADAGERGLDRTEHERPEGSEVPPKHVAVEGVHDHRAGPPCDQGRHPAHRSRLGGVRVHDVWTHATDDPCELADGDDVAQRGELT